MPAPWPDKLYASVPESQVSPSPLYAMVTPSDTVNLIKVSREIRCQVGGTLTVIRSHDHTSVTLTVMDGEKIAIQADQIMATGTAATGILVLF